MSLRRNTYRFVSLVLTVALLVFAFGYISNIIRQVDFGTVSISWPFMLLSVGLFIVFYTLLSLHWLFSCRILSAGLNRKQALAFLASQPYKYLPTSLFTFSFRAVYAKKLGLSFKQSSVAQVLENSSMIASNFVLFLAVYLSSINAIYGLLVATTVAATLFLLERYKKNIHIRFKSRQLTIATSQLLKMYGVATLAWLMSGLAFIALNGALGLSIDFLDLLAANTIAFSLSLLAFFAPGGIGVREAVYGFFAVSGVAIIFWRILTFVLDFILGGVAILVTRRQAE